VPSPTPPTTEDTVIVHGYRLFWKSVGVGGPGRDVLLLHGGPGATHDYLLSFIDLTRQGYRVIFYDQLGCGRSELARHVSEYSVDRDVEDLEELRTRLGLDRFHLIGSSYGGLLAIAYVLAHPEPIASLTSASGLADVPLTVREMQRLKRELPEAVRETLERHEAREEFDHPEYLVAVNEFYRRHLCRLPEWPAEVRYTLDHMSLPKYGTMNGPNEFTITGTIRDYDATPRLGEIRIPTLVTTGRYDEVTPAVAESIHRGIHGSRLVRFEESSHMAFWEERGLYMDTVAGFLREHSGNRPGSAAPTA
jgi:proline iminopeptidase